MKHPRAPTKEDVGRRTKEVVVAWFRENIGWIRSYELQNITTVYCKGGGTIHPDAGLRRCVELPNVGREGHTYLQHIVDNYDSLADVTFFLQGDCVDHANKAIYSRVAACDDVDWFLPLSSRSLTMNDFQCSCWSDDGRDLMSAMYNDMFESAAPKYVSFGPGAIFAASRAAIRFRSLEFWKRLLAIMEGGGVDPIQGYALERFWPLIFCRDCVEKKLKKASLDDDITAQEENDEAGY